LLGVLIGALLVLSIFLCYGRASSYPFINFDDDQYVYQNPYVTRGLTAGGVAWAFRSFHAGNWHPVTWVSHMLDVELFGLDAGRHHLSSLFLHATNTLLLCFLLVRMTGAIWRSTLVAALFALHPLHVESVAWVAERKDLLSSFFFLLTLWAYEHHVKARSWRSHLLLAIPFAAGLMSKPMLVTTPFVLLLLDYWPLGRWRATAENSTCKGALRTTLFRLAREKSLLFVLAVTSSVITVLAQQKGGAVASLDIIPAGSRVLNALAAYFTYLQKMVWPSGLAILYPVSAAGAEGWKALLGLALVVGGSSIAVWQAPKRGHLVTGWFWYLGMLVPVVGLVQVGSQSMADRYTYLPLIGMFILIAWELDRLSSSWGERARWAVACACVAAVLALAVRTYAQVGKWSSEVTLYEHTLEVAPDNPSLLLNLGSALMSQGRLGEAARHYEHVLRLRPEDARAHAALGTVLAQTGEQAAAVSHLDRALSLDPRLPQAYRSMGVLLLSQKRIPEATSMLREAVRLEANDADARNSLGAALLLQGRAREAIEQFSAALEIRPGFGQALENLKVARAAAAPPPAK
jgi:protein O-mannosyl-transferase